VARAAQAELVYRFSKSRVYLLPTADTELSKVFEVLVQVCALHRLSNM
jgi:hypothetical protein